MKYILTILLTFITFAHASVMNIDSYEISEKETHIRLNNGTIWTYKDTDLFKGDHGWMIGDRMHIVSVFLEGYFLENASCQGCVPVTLENPASDEVKALRIVEIVANPEKRTNTIVLDDETHWFIGSWSSSWMEKWAINDRILVTPQKFLFGNAENLLINLDKGGELAENVRAQLVYPAKQPNIEDENEREGRSWNHYVTKTKLMSRFLLIEIDNQSLWKCEIPEESWEKGDKVIFTDDFTLKNLNNQEEIKAKIFTFYVELRIKKITQKGRKIELTDGSIWTLEEKCKKWQVGDSVIVSANETLSIDTTSHLLTNLRQKSNCAATLIH